jgi:hypothetical protein
MQALAMEKHLKQAQELIRGLGSERARWTKSRDELVLDYI